MSYDVVIIGGGIVGCAIARELMRYQVRALLLEKEIEVGFGASKANTGIIHGGHHASPGTLKGRLEWAGNQMWDELHDDLHFSFRRVGELTIALAEDQMPTLEKLLRQGQEKGMTGLEIWRREQILQEEPNLNPEVVAGLYCPTTGVINAYEACFALIENARLNGLEIRTENLVEGLATDGQVWTVTTPKGEVQTRFVINAAGLYSDHVAELAGVRNFTIYPRKGEEYLLDKRLKGLVKRPIFPVPTPVSKGILVTPTYDGTIMVGPTADAVEDKTDTTTSMAGAEQVFASVQQVVPGISEKDCIAQFAGLRSPADGEDFIIGPTAKRGFINVAGIQSPGLTASPYIAKMVMEILRDEGLALEPKANFTPTIPPPVHFATLPTEAQMELVERDHRYGHIVCRCEYVTEGEVLDAIARGAACLDGLKFRTRVGMGRCQGGFCTWRCMQLLAQELKRPMTQITKRGGNSWILCERNEEV